MNLMEKLGQSHLRTDLPDIQSGDTLRVHLKIREGDKERVQVFEGICIARKGRRGGESITVRKSSFGIGVERVFPLSSPRVEKIEIVARGQVRRAKLFYLRDLSGKAARIKERMDVRHGAKPAVAPAAPAATPTTEG